MEDNLGNFVREIRKKYRSEIEEIIELRDLLDKILPKEMYFYKFDYTSNE